MTTVQRFTLYFLHAIAKVLSIVLRRFRPHTRRYIPSVLGVEVFFRELRNQNINYVVLRWFDDLPHVKPGEDIDILIGDACINEITKLLTPFKWLGTPIDLYSVSGRPGTAYNDMSYYPPRLATELLKGAVLDKNGIRILPDALYFKALVYHAIFHKGEHSGLPLNVLSEPKTITPEHDYREFLSTLQERIDIPPIALTLSDLYDFLENANWVPSIDNQLRIAAYNPWITSKFTTRTQSTLKWSRFVVFVVRARALPHIPEIRNALQATGFEILLEKVLDDAASSTVSIAVRGGNWGKGPWPVSGGTPRCVFITYYPLIATNNKIVDMSHSEDITEKVIYTKQIIRNIVNSKYNKISRFNAIHSSDNALEANEYMRASGLCEKELTHIYRAACAIETSMSCPHEVIKVLDGHQRRAIVRLIKYNGALAVCKTFRPSCTTYAKAEVHARNIAQKYKISYITKIIAANKQHVIIEYIDCASRRTTATFEEYKQIRQLLLAFRNAGFELADFRPHNILLDINGDMRVTDFEFLHETTQKTDLKGCWCWYSCPSSAEGLPLENQLRITSRSNYSGAWRQYMKLPRQVMVSGCHRTTFNILQKMYLFAYGIQKVFKGAYHLLGNHLK